MMASTRRTAFCALLSALLVAGAGASLAAVKIGAPAPAFVGPDFEGVTLDLAALRGKVVVVHVWASWCPPCRAEMPALDAFARAHPADVAVVALSADSRRDLPKARQIMTAFSYRAASREQARLDGFGPPPSLPVTWLIDRRGVVREAFSPAHGLLTRQRLETALAGLEKTPPAS
ncbi:MAG TPA: TlpA disulfide reductase family protein [Caulobacteraceae bacterium]|jgi:thiol-disulfide isomerase/thioredoxin|nr:TlpA disulfide reductase family protein [Caulobacteraceae bacterium]